jgi:hypothetical protein
MDAEVNDELVAIVALFGGALTYGPDGRDLLATFPKAPVGGTGTTE